MSKQYKSRGRCRGRHFIAGTKRVQRSFEAATEVVAEATQEPVIQMARGCSNRAKIAKGLAREAVESFFKNSIAYRHHG